ncbi:MAG: peptidoglycan DD-metalloendopeptidase family protein [Colwellia sp.]
MQYQFKKLENFFLQLPKQHRIVISSVSILLLLMLLLPSENNTKTKNLEIGKRYQVAMPQTANTNNNHNIAISLPSLASKSLDHTPKNTIKPTTTPPPKDSTWQTTTVRSGDSLARIFKRLGFSAQTTYAVSTAKGSDIKLLKKLNIGDKLRIASNSNQQLTALEYPLTKIDTLYVNLVGDGYQSHKETKQVEIQETFAHGVITSNFWNSAVAAGLTDNQIINFANIFGWDVDFALDIRAGDSFHIIFEKRYVEGEYIGNGKILAAEFINQDDPFQAVRFTDDEYYTPNGNSMRKAFLRAPVSFKYISSNFKRRRFHPVQKRWKAHRGIDYAAKTGTPVVAAGNGKVTHATYNKYNGNYVFIQHGNGIITKYLHFSKRAVKKGQRVKQGQIIGYVGSTGLAAGPHLHYEFLLNGVHRNPRTVKLPDAKPIEKKYKTAFSKLAVKRLQELEGSKNALLSMSEREINNTDTMNTSTLNADD